MYKLYDLKVYVQFSYVSDANITYQGQEEYHNMYKDAVHS